MDLRRWEDLDTDCLVQVFKKVDTYTLLFAVQFVCKSWRKVTLHKECWENLDFQYVPDRKNIVNGTRLNDAAAENRTRSYNTYLIKLAVSRSRGTISKAVLPRLFYSNALCRIVDECPGLRSLELPTLGREGNHFHEAKSWVLDILGKLKSLEVLDIGFISYELMELLSVLNFQGNNLVSLSISMKNRDRSCYRIRHIGSTIVQLVPKIKYLTLWNCLLDREEVLKILTSCRELILFDIRESGGFGHVKFDDEILKKASHIKRFLFPEHGYRTDIEKLELFRCCYVTHLIDSDQDGCCL